MYSAHIRGFRAGGLAVDRNLRAEPSDGQRGRQRLNHDEDAKRHPEPKPKHLAEQEATHTESSEQCEDVQAHRLRSEEHTSELQSLMRHSYAVFCLKKTKNII